VRLTPTNVYSEIVYKTDDYGLKESITLDLTGVRRYWAARAGISN